VCYVFKVFKTCFLRSLAIIYINKGQVQFFEVQISKKSETLIHCWVNPISMIGIIGLIKELKNITPRDSRFQVYCAKFCDLGGIFFLRT